MHTYRKIEESLAENSIQSRIHSNTTERKTYPGATTGKVEGKLNKLMNQNYLIKLDKSSDR